MKDRLKSSALGLSGGQQQRLCIARCVAVEPDVILMDEPCSALDPIATARIEDLMKEIKADYTIVIVTHNMQQAARVSDRTAFFTTEVNTESDRRTGRARRVQPDGEDVLEPRRRAHRGVHHGAVRLMATRPTSRGAGARGARGPPPGFHQPSTRSATSIARLAAGVTEMIPRATEILLARISKAPST